MQNGNGAFMGGRFADFDVHSGPDSSEPGLDDMGTEQQPGFGQQPPPQATQQPPPQQPPFQQQPHAQPQTPAPYQASMPWQDPVMGRMAAGGRARKLMSVLLAAGIGALGGAWIGYRWAKK